MLNRMWALDVSTYKTKPEQNTWGKIKCQFCLVFVGLLRNISSVICWLLLVHSWPTPAMLALSISNAYHLYGNFGENFPSNGTGNFFASKQELDRIVPFTKYRQIFRFLSRGFLALVIQTNGTENFGCSSKSILRACLHGVGDPGLVELVSFVFTLWRTQTKETYPTRPRSPTPCKQGLIQYRFINERLS